MKGNYLLAFIIIAFGCSNKRDNNLRYSKEQISSLQIESAKLLNVENESIIKIDINSLLKKQSFDFGSIVEDVKLIPLETNDESIIDGIYNVVVTENNIYIHDKYKGGGIIIFDREGKFVRRIPNGQGPGELVRLYGIAFDYENNQLIAYLHSYFFHYTPSGEFIKSERLPFGFYNFSVIPEGYVFKTIDDKQGNEHLGNLNKYMFMVTDKKFKLKSIGLPYSIDYSGFKTFNYIYNNSELLITHQLNDTVFQYNVEADKIIAKYVIDYHKNKVPEDYVSSSFEIFMDFVKKNDYYFFIGDFLETDSFTCMHLKNQKSGNAVIYRSKKSGNLIGGTDAQLNIHEMPPTPFPKWVSGSYFISDYSINGKEPFIMNSSIINEYEKNRIRNLTVNENPVLVFFRLKDF